MKSKRHKEKDWKTKDANNLQKLEEAGRILSRAVRGREALLLTLWFWTCVLHNCETIFLLF